TGPDLTDIGNRQPSKDWNLVHLYNPRIVVKESVMPAYPWLFTIKKTPSKSDVLVKVPEQYLKGQQGSLVAKKEALYLVAYLQSLKQTKLPDGTEAPAFLYKMPEKNKTEGAAQSNAPDGQTLYTAN